VFLLNTLYVYLIIDTACRLKSNMLYNV